MKHQEQTLLAFDYGKKKIGVAVGQTLTRTSTPLTTINAKRKVPDWNAINSLINQWKPDAFVVGLPLNMDGTEQEITIHAKRFANQLQGRYGIPVHTSDERLSTREAYDRLIQHGLSTTPDSIAAQIILEDWLTQNETKS